MRLPDSLQNSTELLTLPNFSKVQLLIHFKQLCCQITNERGIATAKRKGMIQIGLLVTHFAYLL